MTHMPPLPFRREEARRRRQAERARGRFAGPFVFLDFDGVLNHTGWFKTRRSGVGPTTGNGTTSPSIACASSG